jgi:hypothetical protein
LTILASSQEDILLASFVLSMRITAVSTRKENSCTHVLFYILQCNENSVQRCYLGELSIRVNLILVGDEYYFNIRIKLKARKKVLQVELLHFYQRLKRRAQRTRNLVLGKGDGIIERGDYQHY